MPDQMANTALPSCLIVIHVTLCYQGHECQSAIPIANFALIEDLKRSRDYNNKQLAIAHYQALVTAYMFKYTTAAAVADLGG